MIGEIRKIKTSDNPCSLIQQFQKDEKIVTKENHIKNCKYRNQNGCCTRNHRQCTALIISLTFNN